MTVNYVVEMAKLGELKGIAVANKDESILSYLNLGMIELYKRFQLATSEVVLTMGKDGTEVGEDYTKISDTIYKLPSNCMSITAAYDEIEKDEVGVIDNVIPINDESNPLSIMMVGYNTIQIPIATAGAHISIIYQANPTVVTIADYNGDVELELPSTLLEALLMYIGYRAHGVVKGKDSADTASHRKEFEASCGRANLLGLVVTEDYTSKDVSKKGFI